MSGEVGGGRSGEIDALVAKYQRQAFNATGRYVRAVDVVADLRALRTSRKPIASDSEAGE